MKRITFFFLFLIYPLSAISQQQGSDRFSQVVSRLTSAINASDYARIIQEYNSGMLSAFPLNKTTLFFQNIKSQYGNITKIDSPQVKSTDQAVCLLYFERGAQDMTLYLDETGKIKGFLFTTHVITEPKPITGPSPAPAQPKVETNNPPPSTAPKPVTVESKTPASDPKPVKTPAVTPPATTTTTPIPVTTPKPEVPVITDKQQTELSLPFKGTWIIDSRQNSDLPSLLQQQYSFRFFGVETDGSRYRNDGKTNEDFFGYGREVLAPADGTVTELIDGVRENSPGTSNSYVPIGNTIIIQHSSREFSVLSFLKRGSFRVKLGDKVTRGQVIAQCGNSGNIKEPALHYHLQDSPNLQIAKGIKFYFERTAVIKNGKKEPASVYLPKNGEIVSSEQQ